MFYIYRTISNILIEIFNLFETEFIYNLIIFVYSNDLIGRIKVITISIFQMILTCYNNKWRHCPTIKINVLDYNNLFLIIRLYSFNFFTLVVQYYNKSGRDLVYKKACLVEIPNVGFYNIIFSNYILEKSKLNSNDF